MVSFKSPLGRNHFFNGSKPIIRKRFFPLKFQTVLLEWVSFTFLTLLSIGHDFIKQGLYTWSNREIF